MNGNESGPTGPIDKYEAKKQNYVSNYQDERNASKFSTTNNNEEFYPQTS